MKKFLRIFCVAILVLSMLFSVACGGDGEGDTTITETEWAQISDTYFTVETLGYVAIKANANSYEKYRFSVDGGSFENTYLNGIYKVGKEGGVWQPMQNVDQNEYNYNIAGFKGIIDYVKNNPADFTYKNGKYSVTLDNNNDELRKNILLSLQVLEIEDFGMQSIQVEKYQLNNKNYIKITIVGTKNGLSTVVINLQSSVLQYTMDKSLESLNSFVIKGGPSLTDVDYLEAYFTKDGFRIYNPNNPDPTRRDGYFKHDTTEDKYYAYRQDANGVWSVQETSYLNFESARSAAFDLYFGNILEQSSLLYCDFSSARCYNRQTIKKTMMMSGVVSEISYFNINITISNVFTLSAGATWDMQIKQGQAQSLVYHIALETTPFTLEYPQV